ncbi:hypothetical protein [Candidatus Cyanaurora vandensis]|uniref:hypothetical protein n=1 Tax=Candidatus Cyanaurora vandensis TaxID=2714958 RepID=UPI00257AB0E4|nr:hypothetical protein [Candidatus Cyanaurora vandensis]
MPCRLNFHLLSTFFGLGTGLGSLGFLFFPVQFWDFTLVGMVLALVVGMGIWCFAQMLSPA